MSFCINNFSPCTCQDGDLEVVHPEPIESRRQALKACVQRVQLGLSNRTCHMSGEGSFTAWCSKGGFGLGGLSYSSLSAGVSICVLRFTNRRALWLVLEVRPKLKSLSHKLEILLTLIPSRL